MGNEIKKRLRRVADDLVTLEINTIVKSGITGRAMPEPLKALGEIAVNYDRKLSEAGLGLNTTQLAQLDKTTLLKQLEAQAEKGIKTLNAKAESQALSDEEETKMRMLFRIRTSCDYLAPVADKCMAQKELDYKEIVSIRKYWEIGTEHIVMQTVVQLDGDVVTRIDPKFTGNNSSTLHQLHHQAMNTAINTWGELAKMLQSFLKMMIDFAKQ